MGLDGISYYFARTNENGEIIIGEKWSPDENTLMERLVIICDSIYSFSKGRNISQKKIEDRITRLINDIKN